MSDICPVCGVELTDLDADDPMGIDCNQCYDEYVNELDSYSGTYDVWELGGEA